MSHLPYDDGVRQRGEEVDALICQPEPLRPKDLLLQLLEELPLAEDRYLVQGHMDSSGIAHIQ